MKRVLVSHLPKQGTKVELSHEEHHHLVQVGRVEVGTELEILDGNGGLATATIMAISKNKAILQINAHLQQQRESPLTLRLGLALPQQKSTLEELVPALVQLGVTDIHLLQSQFSGRIKGPLPKFLDRLDTIARQALKQCGRLLLPRIHSPVPCQVAISDMLQTADLAIIFHP